MKTYIKNKDDFIKILIKNGLTQQDLADSFGVTRAYVNGIVNGRPVGVKLTKKICDLLQKDFDEIFLIIKEGGFNVY